MQVASATEMMGVIWAGCLALGVIGLQNAEAVEEQTGVVVWVSSPLIKVFKDTPPPQGPTAQEVSIMACRNEYEPAQVCVTSSDYEGPVRVKVSPLTHVSGRYTISTINSRFVGYVPVPQNTPGGRQNLPKDAVIRKAPGMFPDPLVLDKQVDLKPGETQPVWVTVKIPSDAAPGKYRGNILIVTRGATTSLPVRLEVYPMVIPQTTNFWMGGWMHSFLASGAGVIDDPLQIERDRRWEEYDKPEYITFLKDEILRNLYEHRSRVFSDHLCWFLTSQIRTIRQADGYSYDFTRFDKFVEAIQEGLHGQFRIIGLHPGYGGVYNPDGSAVNEEELFDEQSLDDAGYRQFLADYYQALEAHLREKGWLDNIYIKIRDEILKDQIAWSLRWSEFINEVAPGLRFNETVVRLEMLNAEHIDLHLVVHYLFYQYPNLVKGTIDQVQELWNYNNLRSMIDLPLIHIRIMGWLGYRYGLAGYHHWAWAWNTSGWSNPYVEPFGPGQGFLVYSGENGKIVDSIRWEMFRETEEDYELLYLLEKAGGDAQKFCRRLVKSWTEYETDPRRFYRVRRRILIELDRLY